MPFASGSGHPISGNLGLRITDTAGNQKDTIGLFIVFVVGFQGCLALLFLHGIMNQHADEH
jgi:hypothetical protein